MKALKIITSIFLATALCTTVTTIISCNEKPQTKDIITKKPVKPTPKPTQDMGDYKQNRSIEWLGGTYTIYVERKADRQLPLAIDETGNKYFDNRITLTIKRSDGSDFFNRTFSKNDFIQYVDEEYKDGGMLGIVFDCIDGDKLRFAASIGSPDKMSDNYVPLVLTITRVGGVAIDKDTKLDTTSDENANLEDDDEDGV